MIEILLFIILFILLMVVFLLLYIVLEIKKIHKEKYITSNEAKFLDFVSDMYIQYAKELNIHSEEQHEYITKQLNNIREKHLVPKFKKD